MISRLDEFDGWHQPGSTRASRFSGPAKACHYPGFEYPLDYIWSVSNKDHRLYGPQTTYDAFKVWRVNNKTLYFKKD